MGFGIGSFGKIASGIGGAFKKAVPYYNQFAPMFGLPQMPDDTMRSVEGLGGIIEGLGSGAQVVGDAMLSPSDMGRHAGKAQAEMLKRGYPGTTAWEQLGAGQGGSAAATENRKLGVQQSMQQRELNTRSRIADKNALATIYPHLVKEHPHLAYAVGKTFATGAQSIGPNVSRAMSERQYDLQRLDRALTSEKISVDKFAAGTNRILSTIRGDEFEWRKTYESALLQFKDKEIAIQVTDLMKRVYETMGAKNAWSFIHNSIQNYARRGDHGAASFLRMFEGRFKDLTGVDLSPAFESGSATEPRTSAVPPRYRSSSQPSHRLRTRGRY